MQRHFTFSKRPYARHCRFHALFAAIMAARLNQKNTMITLNNNEMMLVVGGDNAAETWGAQAAADGLNQGSNANPLFWVPGAALAIAGAAAYYSGWAWSAIW